MYIFYIFVSTVSFFVKILSVFQAIVSNDFTSSSRLTSTATLPTQFPDLLPALLLSSGCFSIRSHRSPSVLCSARIIGNDTMALNRSPSIISSNGPFCRFSQAFAMDSPRPLPSVVLATSPLDKRSVSSSGLIFNGFSDTFLMVKMALSFPPSHPHTPGCAPWHT